MAGFKEYAPVPLDPASKPRAGGSGHEHHEHHEHQPGHWRGAGRDWVDGAAEVDRAVARAQDAQRHWAAMTGAARARVLRQAADILRSRNRELAELETRDTGKADSGDARGRCGFRCRLSGIFSPVWRPACPASHLDLGPQAFGYTRREALGVVAGIGAWNYPLQIACWKAAAGTGLRQCDAVQAAELTPLTAIRLAEVLGRPGCRRVVFQVVQGYADTERLVDPPSQGSARCR